MEKAKNLLAVIKSYNLPTMFQSNNKNDETAKEDEKDDLFLDTHTLHRGRDQLHNRKLLIAKEVNGE